VGEKRKLKGKIGKPSRGSRSGGARDKGTTGGAFPREREKVKKKQIQIDEKQKKNKKAVARKTPAHGGKGKKINKEALWWGTFGEQGVVSQEPKKSIRGGRGQLGL